MTNEHMISKLEIKSNASCGCFTKTHKYEHHDEHCLYRVLQEAIEHIQNLSQSKE